MAEPRPLAPTFAASLDAGLSTTNYSGYNKGDNSYTQFLIGNKSVDQGLLDKLRTNPNAVSESNTNFGAVTRNQSFVNSNLFQEFISVNKSQQSSSITPNSLAGRPNPLNKYANYTYHIRLSMADEVSAYSPDPGATSLNRRVIAETGKTVGFNITKFSFTNSVSPGFKHQNMNVMNWRMTITEPFGLTFSDAMQAAATELKIQNHSRFPLFLELWFNGYDENGNIQPQIEGIYKIWRIMILNCSLQTTQAGTVYELEGTTDNDLCNTNQLAMTKSMLNMGDVKTLQQLATKLGEQLTKDATKADNRETLKYTINLPDEMKSWQIFPTDPNKQNPKLFGPNGLTIPINRGQDIGAFIASMISKCDEANKFLSGTPNNSTVNQASIESHGLAKFIQIVPQMNVTGYDATFKDYIREIVFNVVPFYTPRCVKDPDQAATQKQLTNQERKFAFWNETGMLAKKYEYIYTGKNTEIIKFDISIENLWQIIVPGYLGSRTYSNFTHGAVIAPNSFGTSENNRYLTLNKVIAELTAKAANPVDFINQFTGGLASEYSQTLNNFNSVISGFNTTVNTLSGSIESVTASVNNISQSLGFGTNLSLTNPISQFSTTSITAFDQIKQKAFDLANINQTADALSFSVDRQDLRDRYIEEIERVRLGTNPDDPDPLQVPFFTDNNPTQQNAVNNGNDGKALVTPEIKSGKYPIGQGLFGAMMANIYDPTYFLSITLEIRGDPWWIGMTNLEANQYLVGKKTSNDIVASGYADFLQGENIFLLTFQTGTNYDEETGLMKLEGGSQYFNGLYSVLEVENRFEGGNFTQTLTAYKEMFSQTIDKLLTPNAKPANAVTSAAPNIPGIISQGESAPNDALISTNLTTPSATSVA